jgi:hypothetical protein
MAQDPTPPPVPKQLPRELLPREFQSILLRLEQSYGSELEVTTSDPQWLEVNVEEMSGKELFDELQSEKNVLFAGLEGRVQMIQPQSQSEDGLYFHLPVAPDWSGRGDFGFFAK